MMKNLLSFLFVIAFLFGGALAVSAKTSSSPANSVAVSKRVLVVMAKANSLKTRCKFDDCGIELQLLLNINDIYEQACPPPYYASCEPGLASALITAGNDYERCLNSPLNSKNTDETMDRNKTAKPRDVTSR